MAENRYRINSVYTACMLIKEMAASADPTNVVEASKLLGISTDVAFRTFKTLEECGFVTATQGGYVPGENLAQAWKTYRLYQKQSIERAKKALKDTAISGEED
ncbi:MAG: hypothetical protein A4E60_00969 [Syntrophorhabdus sp. PtaB.Bin047]|jgi:DNA-binding IclR family transcriptional regulator|nr:MAG: hypothetical protein A4E60_00969 [Syntrophorhabdus sp. PtaB.Bin047]